MCKEALILTSLILVGCSAAGPTKTGGTSSANTQEHFETGIVRLECEIMCSGRWGANQKEAAAFYELKSWKMLAEKVMEIGYGSDLTYYYLAKSAENLGYPDAAKTYYTLAAVSIYKCDTLLNTCNGLKPTQLSKAKLTMPNDIATVPTAPVAAKAVVVTQAAPAPAPAPVAPPAPAKNGISLPQNGKYVSEREFTLDNESKLNSRFIQKINEVIGKTFWYKPNHDAISKVEFFEPGNNGGAPDSIFGEKFIVNYEAEFDVIGYDQGKGGDYFLKLEFSDGKSGFMLVDSLAKARPDEYPVIRNIYPGMFNCSECQEYIFDRPPGEIFSANKKAAAERKKRQAKAAAELRSRGGVKVGMTAEQALSSSWGKPVKINRTTTQGGVREQWVYGGRNYLYFHNGVLTAIQN